MKVDVEDVSTVKKILHVEIPEADVTRELEKAYRTLKKNVRIKGFRPGKVPRSIIEQRFKKDMHTEASGQLIQNSYVEALRETELVPLGEPIIDHSDLEGGQPYHYSVTIEVRPPVQELNIKGLKLKKKECRVTDEEVETQLKMLQKNLAQLRTIEEDRPVENGDFVLIDYEGFKDGKPFTPVSKTENFNVQVGSGRILKDFDQQLLGMRPNTSKEFLVHFPADYYNKDLAGLDITFKVTLKEIKEEILPEIDDEFAKDLGEHETLAELKQAIQKELERRYETQSERELRHDIIDMLIEQADFELPEVLVSHELSALVREARNALSYRGLSLEEVGQAEERLSKQYRSLAERRVREYLLLQRVIEQEGLTVTDEMLEQAYKEMAEAMNQPVETIKQFHNSYEEAYEVFKQRTLEEQAIKRIIENSTIERIEVETAEAQRPETNSVKTEIEPERLEQGDS
ncbi:MAG: trigger factor [Deltaproteobacteria bacterium]|nr:trigger factor [Deltaproteobacteria bacterium]MBW2019715.1 trigger factor [Deltaproteobacteria bacterium]MBW2074518.1 trigger factor [Deltaproteobacteria bacterium]RLB81795.1 MAG: trigger factor [Deltaproteobacteria bacterium]